MHETRGVSLYTRSPSDLRLDGASLGITATFLSKAGMKVLTYMPLRVSEGVKGNLYIEPTFVKGRTEYIPVTLLDPFIDGLFARVLTPTGIEIRRADQTLYEIRMIE